MWPSALQFSGTAYVLNQVQAIQGKSHHEELERAVDAQQPAIKALDDRLELSVGSVKYDGEGEVYVESADDPERAEGYQYGDKVDLVHIRLKRADEPVQGVTIPKGITLPVNEPFDLATWIVRKPGQSAADFVKDMVAKARSFFEDCKPMLEEDASL